MAVSVFLFTFAQKLVNMISDTIYELLKLFKESKNGLNEKEYKELTKDMEYVRSTYDLFIGDEYIEPTYTREQRYQLSKNGIKAMEDRERWLNYKPVMRKPSAGTGFVIVEHKSATFGTGTYNMAYTHNIGLTSELSNAKVYSSREDAEKDIKWFWEDTPCKHQNPEDYEFTAEEVKLTVDVKLPTTFICKDCGKVLPIEKYVVSTYCPNSWETGKCGDCARRSKMRERERVLGVYAYESID